MTKKISSDSQFLCGVIFTPTYIDIKKFDAERFVRRLKQSSVDYIVVDVTEHAGNYAFYPSKFAPHHPLLNGRDAFGELVAECDKSGISVYARLLFNFLDDISAARHPEMLALKADGQPCTWMTHNADVPGFWRPRTFTCMNSPYLREHMKNVMNEVAQRYPSVKGILTDTFWQAWVCHCKHCRKKYAEQVGMPLPEKAGVNEPYWQEWERWSSECVAELNRWFANEVKSANPDWIFFPNVMDTLHPFGFGVNGGADYQQYQDISDVAFVEVLAWYLTERHSPFLQPMVDVRYASSFGKRSVCMVEFTSRSPMGLWNAVANPRAEMMINIAQTIANGGTPMCWLEVDPDVYDDDMFEGLGAIYSKLNEKRDWFIRRKLSADIAAFVSMETMHSCAIGEPKTEYRPSIDGVHRALVEEHAQFHIISEWHLTGSASELDKYKMIILPQSAAMSDECAERIRKYVNDGGVILATGQTSLYETDGSMRDNFALADVFGADFKSTVQQGTQEGVDQWGANVLGGFTAQVLKSVGPTAEFESRRLLPFDSYVHIQPHKSTDVLATVCLPIWPYGSWPTSNSIYTDHPAIIVNSYGKGKAIYISGRIFHSYHIYSHPYYRKVLRGVLNAYVREPLLVADIPSSVEINVFEHPDGIAIDMVNYTGRTGRPFDNIVPIYDIKFSIRLTGAIENPNIQTLTGAKIETQTNGDYLMCTLNKLHIYETIFISNK